MRACVPVITPSGVEKQQSQRTQRVGMARRELNRIVGREFLPRGGVELAGLEIERHAEAERR